MFLQLCRSCPKFISLSNSRSFSFKSRTIRPFFVQKDQNIDFFRRSILVRRFSSYDDVVLSKSRSSIDDESATKMEENRDVQTLLNLIIERLRERGTELILTDLFLKNLEQSPLALLLKGGPTLKLDYIAEAFVLRPKFLEIPTHKWEAILKTFQNADISYGIVLAALVGHPVIFQMEPQEINRILVTLSSWGIRDRVLATVLAKRPQILSLNMSDVLSFIENMNSFFSRKKLSIMIRRDPELLFTPFEKLEAKYEYIYNEMGLESDDVFESKNWSRLTLPQIECRHQFLIRCGVYVMPSEKKAEVATGNPKLQTILDSDDNQFAGLGRVSLSEWETFKKIYADEEPFQPNRVSNRYLLRTGRTAQREQDEGERKEAKTRKNRDQDEEGWEDVSEDEIEEYMRPEKNAPPTKPTPMTYREKRQFRKRGIFLASED